MGQVVLKSARSSQTKDSADDPLLHRPSLVTRKHPQLKPQLPPHPRLAAWVCCRLLQTTGPGRQNTAVHAGSGVYKAWPHSISATIFILTRSPCRVHLVHETNIIMREIVHLQTGQCGNQIGAKVRQICTGVFVSVTWPCSARYVVNWRRIKWWLLAAYIILNIYYNKFHHLSHHTYLMK